MHRTSALACVVALAACSGGDGLGSVTPGVSAAATLGAPAHARAAPLVVDFDHDEPGSVPAGWHVGGVDASAPGASWKVVRDPDAPSLPNAFARTAPELGAERGADLCWTSGVRFGDGTLELAFRGDGDAHELGGGPVWHLQDERNYWACRIDAHGSSIRLAVVVDGEATELASAHVALAPGTWHVIRVEHRGTHVACAVDENELLSATDERLRGAGGIGLWSPVGATTAFDDLRVLGDR